MLKNLPKFAIEHPILMIPVFLTIIGGGLIAYTRIPIELQPYVDSPTVGIIITYPGVSAEDMETYFARPIEQKMSVLDDVTFIRSNSQEGRTEVLIGFPYEETNITEKKTAVQTLLTSMLSELPIDPVNTNNPWVVHVDAQNVPILDLNWRRDGWDEVRLREFVDNTIRDVMEAVPGVQSAVPFGGKRRQVQVVVDRNKLAAYGLSILDIRRAIDQTNLSRSAGRLVSNQGDILVRATHLITDPAELNDIPIGSYRDQIVYLKDVARTIDTYAEVRGAYHFNGKPGILMMIVKQPEASDPAVIEGVLKKADEFTREYPGLQYDVAYNRADFIQRIIRNAWLEMFLAFGLTSLVLIAFLNTVTPTVIVLITLPAATIAGFLLWGPAGLTINTPTLMALTFVLGRLVDDSVVMMDVIERHLKMDKTPRQAAIDGAQELVFATLATSVSFWIVVSPNAFLGGSMGTGFYGMTVPMIFANIMSTFLALTLNPMMAAYLFKPYKARLESPMDRFLRWLFRPFTRFIDRMEGGYRWTLNWGLDHRIVIVGITVASIYAGLKIWPYIPWEGMPLQDTGQAVGEVEAWPGTSFEETEKIVSRIEEILLRQPEIKLVSTQIGQEPSFGTFFSGYGVRPVNRAFFKITLTDTDFRVVQFYHQWLDPLTGAARRRSGRDIWQIMDSVQQEALATIPGIRSLYLMEMGATPVNTARAPVEAVFRGDDLEMLDRIGRDALKVADRTPDVHQPFTSWIMAQPQYHLKIDRKRAQELGLSVQSVATQAFYALQGGLTGAFFKPEEGYRHNRILIRYEEDQRSTREDLGQAMITTPAGQTIPLKEVVTLEERMGTDLVYKEDLQYALAVLAQYRQLGLKQATAGLIMGSKTSIPLPKGYTVGPKGMMLDMMDNIDRLYNGLAVALFFIFILLLLQTQSMVSTFAILVNVPLEIMGVIYFIYLRGFFWSPPVMWGITIASAMVMSTGIYLVDKIVQLRREGMGLRDAILTAGPIRLRPVIMTSITTIAAFVPPMFAPPTGMDRFRPICTGIVGALVSSLLLSLIVIPVLYAIMDDIRRFLSAIYQPDQAPTEAQNTLAVVPETEKGGSV